MDANFEAIAQYFPIDAMRRRRDLPAAQSRLAHAFCARQAQVAAALLDFEWQHVVLL